MRRIAVFARRFAILVGAALMLAAIPCQAEAAKAYKPQDWNHYRVVAQGDHMQSWINGVACGDFHDSTDASGFIGFQVHGIQKDTGPYQVRWRNIRIRELKPGEKVE